MNASPCMHPLLTQESLNSLNSSQIISARGAMLFDGDRLVCSSETKVLVVTLSSHPSPRFQYWLATECRKQIAHFGCSNSYLLLWQTTVDHTSESKYNMKGFRFFRASAFHIISSQPIKICSRTLALLKLCVHVAKSIASLRAGEVFSF